jgi:hypothetical protein
VFAALGDTTRLHLVGRLSASGPLSSTRLSEGTTVTWELDPSRFLNARRWRDQISDQWDEAIGRLKAYMEDDS